MKKYLILIIAACLLFTHYTFAQQAGDLDIQFGEDGLVYFPNEERITNIKAQSDGKILALGDSILYRLNADGTTDTSFGNNGIITIECPLSNIDIMPDGEHIIVQVATSCDSTNNNLKVYDVSGNLVNEITISGCGGSLIPVSSGRIRMLDCVQYVRDQNIFDDNDFFIFPDGLPVTGDPRQVTMAQGEGCIITFGATPYIGDNGEPVIFYINKIPDSTFISELLRTDTFPGQDEYIYFGLNPLDVFMQSDGKILYYYHHTGDRYRHVERLNIDGSIDYTFSTIDLLGFGDGHVSQGVALNSHDELVVSFFDDFSQSTLLKLYDKNGGNSNSYVGSILGNFGFDLRNIFVQPDNSVLLAGKEIDYYDWSEKALVAKFTTGTDYSNFIAGNVFRDDNNNCDYDTIESGLEDWLIKIQGDYTTYARSREDGSYNIGILDTGIYAVNLINPNYLWEDFCIEDTIVNVNADIPNHSIDFGVQPAAVCPLLEVDIATPMVRRCFDTYYIVRYRNSGTALAENAYVEVQLDPYFSFLNADIPATNMGENLYVFDVGDIDTGQSDGFRIDVYVDCDSTVLGQTHCVEAHIFPDSICAPAIPFWDESSIEVDAQCLGDSIEFKIKNIGIGDMSDSLEYIVVEDDLIWKIANFQLDSGDDIKFQKPANGEFHRLEAEQSPGHPGNSMPSIFVEGCGTNDNGEISIGFVNYYLLDEGDAFVSIDCQENVGSYDPNDKQAFPVGYGDQHYITDSTNLEYMIRFQNTGTDTAFNIVIRDTLSVYLNMETLRPGVASHSYRYDIEGSNIAVFHFDNIMLPDSNVNEVASHGFIKFNIEQRENNAIGTHISNDAAIYFDFNEPIITNKVLHTIGQDFVGLVTSVTTPPEVSEAGISVNVFPNPFDEYTRFEVQGKAVNELNLIVYDLMGREVVQQQNTNQSFIKLYKNHLSPGVYVFKLIDEQQQLATGKLVVK